MTAPTSRRPSGCEASLDDWLLDRVAAYLHRGAETIEPAVPLAEYGMDSVMAMSLCGDLEDELGIEVEPTLLWDHPTIDRLRSHLATLAPPSAPVADGRRG
ncbi:acyl carrier protein [Streptomyces globisporus]|uniref:acyl carrier protein n=1 Tax=Streptomyces globisporus TaxID=1908 RepID=UPI0004C9A385|nr:acyl carrier protein [Streptomyces globisporus]